MPQTLDDFTQELEEETRRAAPAAVARSDALKAQHILAADLLELRKRRGLNLRQLSARAGIQHGEISPIEGGGANPTAGTLAALARSWACRASCLRASKGPSVRAGARTAARRLMRRAARRPGA